MGLASLAQRGGKTLWKLSSPSFQATADILFGSFRHYQPLISCFYGFWYTTLNISFHIWGQYCQDWKTISNLHLSNSQSFTWEPYQTFYRYWFLWIIICGEKNKTEILWCVSEREKYLQEEADPGKLSSVFLHHPHIFMANWIMHIKSL